MKKIILILSITDAIFWIIFVLTSSGFFGVLGMLFLIIVLSIISGVVGAESDDTAERQRREIRAARINQYQIKNLYNYITNKNKK